MNDSIFIGGVAVPMDNTVDELQATGKEIIRRARIRLARNKKNVTGRLRDSMKAEVDIVEPKDTVFLAFTFKGADYWRFVDLGVKGSRSSKKAPNSPYRFGTGSGRKGGLTAGIDRWVIQKNIKGTRDEQGRFTPRKTLVRLIANKIFTTGIKPSYFFTAPYDAVIKEREPKLALAIGQDLAVLIMQALSPITTPE